MFYLTTQNYVKEIISKSIVDQKSYHIFKIMNLIIKEKK